MLSRVTRAQCRHISIRNYTIRSLSTEAVSSGSPLPPPPPPLKQRPPSRTRLNPAPRPVVMHRRQALPYLPPTFGRNQILPVSDATRALLDDIVAQFNAPIRYAFAYGSGVFEQDGYKTNSPTSKDGPMLDFIFAVTHADHWHSINMNQYPGHYPLHARVLGSSFVSKVEDFSPGVWFNAYIPMKGVVCLQFLFSSVEAHKILL